MLYFLYLALLVQLNLGAGVGADLSEPGAQVLKVPGQQGTVLLGLGAVVALHGQLFIKFVNAGLQAGRKEVFILFLIFVQI